MTQVQITATHLKDAGGQLELFPADAATGDSERRRMRCAAAIDRINARFGEFTLAPAELLGRSSMPTPGVTRTGPCAVERVAPRGRNRMATPKNPAKPRVS